MMVETALNRAPLDGPHVKKRIQLGEGPHKPPPHVGLNGYGVRGAITGAARDYFEIARERLPSPAKRPV